MRLSRRTTCLALALAPVLVLGVACAGQDEHRDAPGAPEPESETFDGGGGAADVREERDDTTPAAAPTCSQDGLCYVSVPVREPLVAVSASSIDDAWMLPEQRDVLLHWDGAALKVAYDYAGEDPSVIVFRGIWAQKKDNVWAVAADSDGKLFIVRYSSGAAGEPPAFRELRTQTPATQMTLALWGAPAGDVLWMVTDTGVVRVHEDDQGNAVVEEQNPTMGPDDRNLYAWRTIWGFGPDDVYVGGRLCRDMFGVCAEGTVLGAIGHYDGTAWSITPVDSATDVLSLRGTAPSSSDRQLWYTSKERRDLENIVRTSLVPAFTDGQLPKPLFSHRVDAPPACSSRIGHASSATSGWFSDGLLVCRWTGAALEPVRTTLSGVPAIHAVNDIWSAGDDAWIVGTSMVRGGLEFAPFAARRRATVDGGM